MVDTLDADPKMELWRRPSSPQWRFLACLVLGSWMLQVVLWWSLAHPPRPNLPSASSLTVAAPTTPHHECLSWSYGTSNETIVEFVEHGFISLHQGYFHYFHWIEFLVMGFVAATHIRGIRVRHMTRHQVCGVMNCQLARMVLGTELVIFGSEDNHHEASNHHTIVQIDRSACVEPTVQKMWWRHMDRFDHDGWYERLRSHLPLSNTQMMIRITYVERQSTRRRLPSSLHDWIVQYLQSIPGATVVRMEELTVTEQFQLAASTDILLGLHGNGLAHQFLMKPHSAVLELFWEFPFAFDYATSATLMGHAYRGIWNGQILDTFRIQALDATLRSEYAAKRVFAWWQTDSTSRTYHRAVEDTKLAIAEFLEQQMERLSRANT